MNKKSILLTLAVFSLVGSLSAGGHGSRRHRRRTDRTRKIPTPATLGHIEGQITTLENGMASEKFDRAGLACFFPRASTNLTQRIKIGQDRLSTLERAFRQEKEQVDKHHATLTSLSTLWRRFNIASISESALEHSYITVTPTVSGKVSPLEQPSSQEEDEDWSDEEGEGTSAAAITQDTDVGSEQGEAGKMSDEAHRAATTVIAALTPAGRGLFQQELEYYRPQAQTSSQPEHDVEAGAVGDGSDSWYAAATNVLATLKLY